MPNVNTIKFLDRYIGNVICFILSFFKLFSKKDVKIKKILIIQLWGIGESVLTLPSINVLRKKFPKASIDILLTERNKDVYFKNKDLDKLISIKLDPISIKLFILKNLKKYDLIVDMEEYLNISSIISFFTGKKRIGFSHNIRSNLYTDTVKYNDKQHTAQTFSDLLKKVGINFKVNKLEKLNYSPNDKKTIDNLFLKNKINKKNLVVGIVPGAAESGRSRMWPKENYSELCNNLNKKKNIKIIFIGSEEEKGLINEVISKIKEKDKVINLAGKISIRELFYLVERCDLIISNDTGPMHISAAQGARTIGLFGPNLPARFSPLNKKSISIYKGNICEYSPCINVHKGEVPDCLYPKDSKEYQKCMKNIGVMNVLKLS